MKTLLRPARVRLIGQDAAPGIVSPPYDMLSRAERRKLAEENPRSFLNATRSPDDFPDSNPAEMIRTALLYLSERLGERSYGPVMEGIFVYRITAGEHAQTGIVADLPVRAFPSRIRPHEQTRVDREDQLAEYLAELGVASSPVGLTYRGTREVDGEIDRVTALPPLLDWVADRERQQVWLVPPETQEHLLDGFGTVEATYIIDGHHRIAAARRHAELLGVDEEHPAGRILGVAFPDHDLRVYPFDRWIDADWPTAEDWAVTDLPQPDPGVAVAVTRDGWKRIDLAPGPGEQDTSALSRIVLGPLFGVADERTDPRLVFVPGALGPSTLVARVRRRGGVGFLLHPTAIEDLMAVSDEGRSMPPKSTFFAPKPRSGIFLVDRRG